MSSMWRAAVIMAVLLATAPSSSAQYARPGKRRCCARHKSEHRRPRSRAGARFARAAATASPITRASSSPIRIGRNDRGCAAGPKRRCSPARMRATVLAFFAAEKPKTGNGWARLADAYRSDRSERRRRSTPRATPGLQRTLARPTSRRSGPAIGPASRAADHDAASMPCCSPRGPTMPPASCRVSSPEPSGGLRRADRHAAERAGRREPLSGGDRQRHDAMPV